MRISSYIVCSKLRVIVSLQRIYDTDLVRPDIMRYLSGTLGEGAQVEMCRHSDSRHAGDKVISRGRSGYVFLSTGAAITWRSAMMKVVTHSSCES